jgi:putative phage-type endonuclease
MDQRTNEWLDWRKNGIGSSDAPIIMGVSPWKTPFELWEEKTNRVKPEETSNWAQERGNELEPIARAKFELECDMEMGPALCQHEDHPWCRASMDGWNPLHKIGLEIKFLGANDFKLAKDQGVVPEKYFPQIQHQFLVTGAKEIIFYGYFVDKGAENHKGISVSVSCKPDIEYISKLAKAEYEFYRCMVEDCPPPYIEKDFKLLRVAGAKALADEYVATPSEEIKQKLFTMAGDMKRFRIGRLRSELKDGLRSLEIYD